MSDIDRLLTQIRSRRSSTAEKTGPNPLLLKIKEDVENAYYDGKEWFDGRKYPERLQELMERIRGEEARAADYEEYDEDSYLAK